MNSILVIQTAFIGDAILGTALLEWLHEKHPTAKIDYLVREGNQTLFEGHPFLNELLIWDKRSSKYSGLWQVLKQIRKSNYDAVYNIQRYAASGFLTGFSGAKQRVGYASNPLSFLFTKSVTHRLGNGHANVHEVERVLDLVEENALQVRPKLYLTTEQNKSVKSYQTLPYVTIAPASVWYTKQYPVSKWVELIDKIPDDVAVMLIGAPSDTTVAEEIEKKVSRPTTVLTGKFKLLETAALMQGAVMNYANDSAPVHLASAVNAPICEVFCSTVPEFGFTPLSDKAHVVQTSEKLNCRPCGNHGKSSCPEGHFKCAQTVDVNKLLEVL